MLEIAGKSAASAPASQPPGDGPRARLAVDPESVRLLPPGHLIDVIAFGSQPGGETSSDDKTARRVGVRGWLPEWLPSLLAITGFSALMLVGVGLGLIKCGVALLRLSRRRVRPPFEKTVSPSIS